MSVVVAEASRNAGEKSTRGRFINARPGRPPDKGPPLPRERRPFVIVPEAGHAAENLGGRIYRWRRLIYRHPVLHLRRYLVGSLRVKIFLPRGMKIFVYLQHRPDRLAALKTETEVCQHVYLLVLMEALEEIKDHAPLRRVHADVMP
jgi:hypothetical protein